jgi:alkaline phosphatase D
MRLSCSYACFKSNIIVSPLQYEYGKYSTYASNSPERKKLIMPDWEQISLQDHRLRLASYSLDEGLENLRRRAPMIAIWDDHETTNNAYGQGKEENTGAENHQPVCDKANATSPDKEKEAAGCDRDEGTATKRFTDAAQAYMEWMPIRKGPGTMGVVTTTSITQVIEWGALATVVAVDSRISHRSKEPTLRSACECFLKYENVFLCFPVDDCCSHYVDQ